MTKSKWLLMAVLLMGCSWSTPAQAQTTDDEDEDIWREVDLDEFDFQKKKNYCVRLYGYYRYIDDGETFAETYITNRMSKLYRIYEGICELDIRYDRREDEGAEIMVARNLVHPDRRGDIMDYYELKPYTFLEKARKRPKRFTIETTGDTTRVYTKRGLAGTVVRDTARQELRMTYNALAPDTAETINIIIVKGHLSHVDADAVYRLDTPDMEYVPQGNLKRITFEGDIEVETTMTNAVSVLEKFHERTEFYVDSVVYMTKDEYKADRKTTVEQRRQRSGYTIADIDRLKLKYGVPPLTTEQEERIEDQRDWEDAEEHWVNTDKRIRAITKTGEKIMEANADKLQQAKEKGEQMAEKYIEKINQERDNDE